MNLKKIYPFLIAFGIFLLLDGVLSIYFGNAVRVLRVVIGAVILGYGVEGIEND